MAAYEAHLSERVQSKKLKLEDALTKYVQLDFTDKYEAVGRSEAKALSLWNLARQGQFPPWTPCKSRGVEAVGRLDPECEGLGNDSMGPSKEPRQNHGGYAENTGYNTPP
jgi:hypothetical protein